VPKTDQLPAFLFYVDDFTSDGVVEAMTTEQVGAYTLLLCKAWREDPPGTIPDDDEILARWARMPAKKWIACRERVLKAFYLGTDGRYHQKRMEAEYVKAVEQQERRQRRARGAADARWNHHPPDNGDAKALLKHRSSIGQAMLVDASQSQGQVTSNKNGQSQAKDQRSMAVENRLDFDLQEVDWAEWNRTFAEFSRQLDAGSEDRRIVAQLAWLVCAGAPILAAVHDALDGITVVRRDGRPPKSPTAYLRACLNESIGESKLDAMLAMAPSRNQCAKLLEGCES
jgi:uncharacterized protein YdaU (DUF1376 family)